MVKWFSRSIKRYSVLFAVILITIISIALMHVLYMVASDSYIKADMGRTFQIRELVAEELGEENLKYLSGKMLAFYLSHPNLEAELSADQEKVLEDFKEIYYDKVYQTTHDNAYDQACNLGFANLRLAIFDFNKKSIITFFDSGDYFDPENALYVKHAPALDPGIDYEYFDTTPEPLFNDTAFGDVYSAVRYVFSDTDDGICVVMLFDSYILTSSILSKYFIRNLVYSLLVIVIIIGVLIFFVIDRRIVTPLNKLSLATRELIQGLYSGQERGHAFENLDIHTGDEIEHLYESIKVMEEGIYDYMDKLKVMTAEQERIGTELEIAEGVQRHMLPKASPDFTDQQCFDLAAAMRPAREVGGDFYDFFMLSKDKLAFLIADVSGKGVPAAFVMAIGKTLLRNYTMDTGDISRAFTIVSNQLISSNSDSMFVTAFEGILDLRTGDLIYANAGHEDPFIMRANEDYIPMKERHSIVLGAIEDMKYKIRRLKLNPGDRIFLYTDGVPEAINHSMEMFSLRRLGDALNSAKNEAPEKVIDEVFRSVDEYAAGEAQFDDITMICLEFRKYFEDEDET